MMAYSNITETRYMGKHTSELAIKGVQRYGKVLDQFFRTSLHRTLKKEEVPLLRREIEECIHDNPTWPLEDTLGAGAISFVLGVEHRERQKRQKTMEAAWDEERKANPLKHMPKLSLSLPDGSREVRVFPTNTKRVLVQRFSSNGTLVQSTVRGRKHQWEGPLVKFFREKDS